MVALLMGSAGLVSRGDAAAAMAVVALVLRMLVAFLAGLWLMLISVLLVFLVVTVFLLWLRVLTTVLLAVATGVEILYGIGAVSVYAEPLPRWRSHANCQLEILGWTEDDAKQMPPLRHSMHRLGFVHQRVADWMVERLERQA